MWPFFFFLVCFLLLFCNSQTQVRYWYPVLNFWIKFSRRQLGLKYYTKFYKGSLLCCVSMLIQMYDDTYDDT